MCVLKFGSQLETTVTNSINLRTPFGKQLQGLDVRILTITILLSLMFLGRFLFDYMFAFNLLSQNLDDSIFGLCVIFLSEVVTSFFVVRIMLSKGRSSLSDGIFLDQENA